MRWTLCVVALRVPLSCALALAFLAPLGAFSFSPFRGMLEGLFDVSGWGAFWADMASWLSAAACWVCSLLVLNYGPRRIAGLCRAGTGLEFRPFPWLAIAFSAAPLSVLAGICAVSADWEHIVTGSAAGWASSLAAWLLHRHWYPRPGPTVIRLIGVLLKWDPSGYRDQVTGELLPGHWMAAQFTASFVALWALIGLLKYHALVNGITSTTLPTSLTYVILLIGLLALALGGLAFFFDRYRIPVLLPWMAVLAVTSLFPGADQFVDTLPAQPGNLALPVELLAASPTPVLVCASGGGIAASAWTAAVLTNLDRLNPGRFAPSLVLFSGASGGSVGGMHFVAACRSTAGCGAAFEKASRSSLDAAAWGLVGPDLIRATVPFAGSVLGRIGRGWALEQAWDPDRALRFPLSSWPARPAVVFNATIVETGEGVGLSNVAWGGRQIARDFSPASAARLSASFPFVTPAPRIDAESYHLADGGYYDNYGVGAAVAFLNSAYRNFAAGLPRRILLIEIRASRPRQPAPAAWASTLLFQWCSPARTMLNVRDTAQRHGNDTTLELLSQALAARGVTLERVQFEIPRDDVPLSWHLTASQIAALRRDWSEHFEESPETRAVSQFLAQQR